MRLSDYQIDVAAIVRDQNNLFTSTFQLNRWINQARDRVAQDSGCLREIIPGTSAFGASAQAGSAVVGGAIPGMPPTSGFFTVPNQEIYPFTYANQYAIAQVAGVRAVVAVYNVAASWGSARPALNWMPWDQMQAYARSYNVGVFGYPMAWSASGVGATNKVWIWPAAQNAQEMEWDCGFLPTWLYTDNDFDSLQDPFNSAVKWDAARRIHISSGRGPQAQEMEQEYWRELGSNSSASDRFGVPNYYPDYDE